LQVNSSRHDIDPRSIGHLAHKPAVIIRNRDDAIKFVYCLAFVPKHLRRFNLVYDAVRDVRFVKRLALPKRGLDVMLKKNGGCFQHSRKVKRGCKKIAHTNVEAIAGEKLANFTLNLRRSEFRDGERRS